MTEKKTTKTVDEAVKSLSLKMEQVVRTESVFNENQVQKIFNTTPAKYKYRRPGKGGGSWDFVRAGYVRRVLDSIFGFNWDFEIDTSALEALEIAEKTGTVTVKGSLVGRVKDRNGTWHTITRTDFGRAEVKRKKESKELLDFGNDVKAAATDCFKRCAARLGIAADVYDPLEFQQIEIVGSEENTDRKKALDKRIKESRTVIDAMGDKVGGENGSKS